VWTETRLLPADAHRECDRYYRNVGHPFGTNRGHERTHRKEFGRLQPKF